MFRIITPVILITVSIVGFLMFTNPLYQNISLLREQSGSYDEALNNSKALENERDKLTQKYNSIDPDNLTKLKKMLPDNVDNIRLILEIEKVAAPYSMVLRDVKYDTLQKQDRAGSSAGIVNTDEDQSMRKDYGAWSLEFSTTGTYNNFINFVRDLEKNLRIVDISSITFSSVSGMESNSLPSLSELYKFSFKIKTYWLKN